MNIDMNKAYEKVEQDYLKDVLLVFGFHCRCVRLITSFVCATSYQIKLNGMIGNRFFPEKGLQQGDLLSSYLFIIIAKTLSLLIRKYE